MKFGKSLQSQIEETMLDWRPHFIAYIELKKSLKTLQAPLDDGTTLVSFLETDFMTLLNKELNKLNVFFIEKEEEYVIRLQKEQAANDGRVRGNCGYEDLLKILRDIVASHGEMVLLENYSSLNYTDLVKIMKKHDKVTGTLLRLRYIQSVLLQPFFTTELLSKLVRLKQEHSTQAFSTDSSNSQAHPYIPGDIVETIFRSIVVALKTMKEIRKRSTPSIFSLPPMNRTDSEEMFGISVDQSLVHPVTVDL
uniref:SPX domain-containing protein n=1 Tax=Physcomitrium patens TaxID=3218 RepID=A0A2K1IIL6_PHYPA|nr:hypothetical protein PHYPA_027811 [Physcomitrium patens]